MRMIQKVAAIGLAVTTVMLGPVNVGGLTALAGEGFVEENGSWYYQGDDGKYVTGQLTLGDTVYSFGAKGTLRQVSRVENTGGGAYEVAILDEASQELFDKMNEEKSEEYFDLYDEREDEYDGDARKSYDRYATYRMTTALNDAAAARLASAREKSYTNGSIPGEGTVKDYLKSVNYRPHATTMELYLRNCDDVDDAWEKFEKKMSERYETRQDRAFSPEYYREAGIAHIEENNKHSFMIILMR